MLISPIVNEFVNINASGPLSDQGVKVLTEGPSELDLSPIATFGIRLQGKVARLQGYKIQIKALCLNDDK